MFLSQFIQNEWVFSLPVRQILLGWICCLFPMLVLFLLTLSPRLSGIVVSAVLLILSTANCYVYEFRGSEVCPSDLLTIGTAANVADQYSYSLPGLVLYPWLLFLLLFFLVTGLPTIKVRRNSTALLSTIFSLIMIGLIFRIESPRITVQHFLHGGSYWNGFLLNFTLQIKEIIVQKPEEYSLKTIKNIGAHYAYEENDEAERINSTGKHSPDIIVIMDEAFSDLGVVGNVLTTKNPVSPFIDSLHDNTTYGYTLSSVYGGGTPNSEYEFLTGNSMLFLNGMIYQQFLREPSYSLVSELKDRGYSCTAMHPYLETGWRRNTVWPNLLFDECYFMDSFPNQNLIRGLISDQEMFEFMLDKYKSRIAENSGPVFLFGVTMQNHSPYDYNGNDFQKTIELEGYDGQYDEVEQYLSLIHETDLAVQYLITELEQINRDVVVVFYGDHQPAVDEAFLKEVHGGSFDSLDERQLLQMIPFFIWTNYESKTEEIGLTSLNYLSNLLFEKAELEPPKYNYFLEDMEKVIPAMNSLGFFSQAANHFVELSDADGIEKEWLDKYWMLEYNSLCDLKNLDPVFFPLKE